MLSRRAFGALATGLALMPSRPWAQTVMDGDELFLGAELYLPLYRELLAKASGGDLSAAGDFMQYAAFVGDEKHATAQRPQGSAASAGLELRATPAIAAIVERARHTRLVILNENHSLSRHRHFALQVLRALRPLGFDIFAAETFSGKPNTGLAQYVEDLRPGAPITFNHGYYHRDPVYAETMRQALSLGYRLAAYEQVASQRLPADASASSIDRIHAREEAQARNLIDHVLTPNPDSRVVVLCGHSHIMEAPQNNPDRGETEWFAARLKRHSGIDPLTIEQSLNYPAFDPANDPHLTRAVLDRLNPQEPVAVFETTGQAFTAQTYAKAVDLAVYHPRKPLVNGRPEWWASDEARHHAPVQFAASSELTLIQALSRAEGMGSVPCDQCLIQPGQTSASLYLRPGHYVIRREEGSGLSYIGSLRIEDGTKT